MKKYIVLAGIVYSIILYSCSSLENDNAKENKAICGNTSRSTESTYSNEAQAIFQANCASCHNPLKDATGPALSGSLARVPSREWLVKWIHNPTKLIQEKDAYAIAIYEKWNKTSMTAFPNLSDEDVNLLIDEYCK
jgi:mono/diheme cytochrome c family protein